MLTPDAVVKLQRLAGNSATSSLIARPAGDVSPGPTVQRATFSVDSCRAEPTSRDLWFQTDRGGAGISLGTGYQAGITFTAKVSGKGDPDDLKDWTAGFIQTMQTSTREAFYDPYRPGDHRLKLAATTPTPVRDGSDDPWYKAEGRRAFTKPDVDQVEITTGDEPRFSIPWTAEADLHDGGGKQPLDLSQTQGRDTFTTWLAVRRRDDPPRALMQVAWLTDFGAGMTVTHADRNVTPAGGSGLRAGAVATANPSPNWVLGGRSANEFAVGELQKTPVPGKGRPAPLTATEAPSADTGQAKRRITTTDDLRAADTVEKATAGTWDYTDYNGNGDEGFEVQRIGEGVLLRIDPTFFVLVPDGGYRAV